MAKNKKVFPAPETLHLDKVRRIGMVTVEGGGPCGVFKMFPKKVFISKMAVKVINQYPESLSWDKGQIIRWLRTNWATHVTMDGALIPGDVARLCFMIADKAHEIGTTRTAAHGTTSPMLDAKPLLPLFVISESTPHPGNAGVFKMTGKQWLVRAATLSAAEVKLLDLNIKGERLGEQILCPGAVLITDPVEWEVEDIFEL